MLNNCVVCGAVFNGRTTAKCCSQKCVGLLQNKSSNIVCPVCGDSFLVKQSQIKVRRCCSGKCYGVWRSQNITGEKNGKWKGGSVVVPCQFCGNEFRRSFFGRKYCSKECSNKGRNVSKPQNCIYCGKQFAPNGRTVRKFCSRVCGFKYMVGKNAPAWKGGKSFEPYTKEFNNVFKQAIRKRDNFQCFICKGYGDNVHHIDYCKANSIPKNCVTLCVVCHSKTNFNREYWQGYFENIMASYS